MCKSLDLKSRHSTPRIWGHDYSEMHLKCSPLKFASHPLGCLLAEKLESRAERNIKYGSCYRKCLVRQLPCAPEVTGSEILRQRLDTPFIALPITFTNSRSPQSPGMAEGVKEALHTVADAISSLKGKEILTNAITRTSKTVWWISGSERNRYHTVVFYGVFRAVKLTVREQKCADQSQVENGASLLTG